MKTLTAVFQKSGDWWAAWVEELPGANTQGRTLDEARENLQEAAQLILEEGETPGLHSRYILDSRGTIPL